MPEGYTAETAPPVGVAPLASALAEATFDLVRGLLEDPPVEGIEDSVALVTVPADDPDSVSGLEPLPTEGTPPVDDSPAHCFSQQPCTIVEYSYHYSPQVRLQSIEQEHISTDQQRV